MKHPRMKILILAAVVLAAVVFAFGCKSDQQRARDAAATFMDGYILVGRPDDKDSKIPKSTPEASYFGDGPTVKKLQGFGVDPEEFRRHCLARMSYQIDSAEVAEGGKTATVTVSITNVSLSDAFKAAQEEFASWMKSDEMQGALTAKGRPGLVEKLFEVLYSKLDAEDATVVTTQTTLSLTKDDEGKWQVDTPPSKDFYAALYGGSQLNFEA